MSSQHGPRRCGKCEKDIRDIEPAQCSCCEQYFHVQQECCDASRSSIQQLFSCHKALWLCVKCRKLFANRTLHGFLEEKIRSQPGREELDDLRNNITELTVLVTTLQKQLGEHHSTITAKLEQTQSVAWPSQSIAPVSNSNSTPSNQRRRNRSKRPVKRRRGSDGAPVEVTEPISSGTSDIDLSDLQLSCPIAAVAPTEKFWIYLSGFNPRITDDDVLKIVRRCLDIDDEPEVFRLVPKDADTSRYTFISYKVGLDPALKQDALLLSKWPNSIKVREFVSNASKNEQRPSQAADTADSLEHPVPISQPDGMETDQ